MKKVITYGTFDLFHEGHYNLLKHAKQLGDYLIVGVTTEHYDEIRGKSRAVNSLEERMENVRKSGFADEIIIEDHEGQKIEDIQKYQVDVFTVGSDWTGAFDYLKTYCEVVYLPRTPNISSTDLRAKQFLVVRLGIVGTGRITDRFWDECRQVSRIRVTTVYNPRRSSAEEFARKHEGDGTALVAADSFEECLEHTDAVYIAAPHENHYAYAKQALLAGKHVLCEKPLAIMGEEAVELFTIARKKKLVLMEAVKTAYAPGFEGILQLVRHGAIGTPHDVEACFTKLVPANTREVWSGYGGSFTELGSYCLLPIVKLFGTESLETYSRCLESLTGNDSFARVMISYGNAVGTAKTGIGVKSDGELVIAGTKGYIQVPSPWWAPRKVFVRHEEPSKIETYEFPFEGSGLRYEIASFAKKVLALEKMTALYAEDGADILDHIWNHVLNIEGLTPSESIWMACQMELVREERQTDSASAVPEQEDEKPGIWAHRGCSMRFPENTLSAFEAAAKIPGLTGIELDIQLTRDGEMVVIHDETVDRTTDGSGKVSDFSLEEIKQLHITGSGCPNRSEFEETVPTLREVFDRMLPYCQKNGLLIDIELKNGKVRYEGMEQKVLALAAEYGLSEHIVYSSFLPESMGLLKKLEPSVKTGILGVDIHDCLEQMERHGADAVHPAVRGLDINPEIMDELCRGNCRIPVRVWNSEEPLYGQVRVLKELHMTKYQRLGATDIITNVPERYL
jgi:glycerol-3-phosphate cytidylyltransferase